MGVFASTKFIPAVVEDLAPVVEEVTHHFEHQGYEVASNKTQRGWDIYLTKGGVFKSILGLKTALKISIEPVKTMTAVKAQVSIFGTQALPTAIAFWVFWPVLIPQIWGLIQQSKLDEEVLACIETSIKARAESETKNPSQ